MSDRLFFLQRYIRIRSVARILSIQASNIHNTGIAVINVVCRFPLKGTPNFRLLLFPLLPYRDCSIKLLYQTCGTHSLSSLRHIPKYPKYTVLASSFFVYNLLIYTLHICNKIHQDD